MASKPKPTRRTQARVAYGKSRTSAALARIETRAKRQRQNAQTPKRERPHGIVWEGPSPFDGAPLVAIVCPDSTNGKTGPLDAVYIIRADVPPMEAIRQGLDASNCGNCPMRGNVSLGGFAERGCYVEVSKGATNVFDAYSRGIYARVGVEAFRGRSVRWGAYGDPAMLPPLLVKLINAVAKDWTGYTHQWLQPWAKWARGIFQASADNEASYRKAKRLGWNTFRVRARGERALMPGEKNCANDRKGTLCIDCMECNGTTDQVVNAHGAGAKWTPSERSLAKLRLPLASARA